MDLKKAKEINEFIIDKSCKNIAGAMEEKQWDKESFEVFSQALDNLRDIEKIEKLEREEYKEMKSEVATEMEIKKVDVTKVDTDFEKLIYSIAEAKPGKAGMLAITTILADHMEDIRLFYPKMYEMVMMKLKNMLY